MSASCLADNQELVAAKLPHGDRRVGGYERLDRRRRLLCPDRAEQSENPMRLKSVFQLVDEDHGRLLSRLALEPCQEKAGGTNAQGSQRHPVRPVQGDRSAAEGYRMGVEHGLEPLAERDA